MMLFALTEALKRDQNREVVFVKEPLRIGLASVFLFWAVDQRCYKFTTKDDFDELWSNDISLETFLKGFKTRLSKCLNI
jgi:hypothetical protein